MRVDDLFRRKREPEPHQPRLPEAALAARAGLACSREMA
jgi:hypothetical protein